MSTDFLVLNSRNRTSYSTNSHDFDIKVQTPVDGVYQIVTCSIPNTFYNINAYNNLIYFNDGSAKTATITPGIYSSSDITTAIKTAMDDQSTITFTVSIGTNTQKLTIAGDSPYTLKFATNTTNSAASILGFTNTDTSSSTSQVATNVINLAYPAGCLVRINDIDNVSTSTSGVSGTLYFPIETNSSDISVFKSENSYAMYASFQRTSLIKVKLLDDQGNPLSLNGADWTICLKKCRM